MFFKLLILSFLITPIKTDCSSSLDKLRIEYHALETQHQITDFIENYSSSLCAYSIPYVASAIMMKAEHTRLPHHKLEFFLKGKKMLERFISQHPESIEGRYVRLLVQSHSPKFLGYNDHIEDDLFFIERNLADSEIPITYQNQIKHQINSLDQ